MAHQIVHWEIMGPDGDGLADFYRGLFGWNLGSPPGFDGYHLSDPEETGVGGAVGTGTDDMPTAVTLYVGVDSIEETLARVEAAGGKTILGRTVIPDMVTYALFADPAGNVTGIVEPS